MRRLAPFLLVAAAAAAPAAAEDAPKATAALWHEYVSACDHPLSEIAASLASAGWTAHEPAPETYLGQLLASSQRGLQSTRDRGDLPQDFDLRMGVQIFAKAIAARDIYLMLIQGPIPDGSGRVLVDCSLLVPDFEGTLSKSEIAALGGSDPEDFSNSLMVKFGWQPGLAANQLKTEIAVLLPAGEAAMQRAGVTASGLTIKSQSLEGAR